MRRWLYGLWLDEAGQDLAEYSMIVAFMVFAAFLLAGTGQASIKTIWHIVTGRLECGVSSAHAGAG